MAKLDLNPIIYVDMDATLVDLRGYVKKLLGYTFGEGHPQKEVWDEAFKADPDLNANLPWLSGAKALWSEAKKHDHQILTAVPFFHRGDVIKGKYKWVRKNLGSNVKVNIVGKFNKEAWARPGDILIDDDAAKWKSKWESKGGIFIHCTSPSKALRELKQVLDK